MSTPAAAAAGASAAATTTTPATAATTAQQAAMMQQAMQLAQIQQMAQMAMAANLAQAGTAGHTVYVRNLNPKTSREALIKSLWSSFQRFGEILDICARPKCRKLRSQAWVSFRDLKAATTAVQYMNGSTFEGRQIFVKFSKNKSDAIAKLDGTFVERKKPTKKKRKAEAQEGGKPSKQARGATNAPNKTLLVANLPPDMDNNTMLTLLFQQFPGFQEIRLAGADSAFVDFDSAPKATHAMTNLQGVRVAGAHTLKISYGK